MGDECRGCRKWEEHVYWSHFQSVQFFLTLSSSYDRQLAVPQKFANNLRGKLAGAVSLRGPSGGLWNVEVTAGGDTCSSSMAGKSLLKIILWKKMMSGCKRKETFPESLEVTNESSHDAVKCVPPPKRPRSNAAKTSKPAGQQPKAGETKSSSKRSTPYKLELSSNRRPVTIQEKEKALQMAHTASSEDSFIVIMQPSHVYKSFYMSIPFDWLKKHLPQKSRKLILRSEESEWPVTFQRKFHNNGGLTVGWRNFVLDNFLEESDVCLFKPAGKTPEAVVFDVSIFRVVEEVIPPCPVTPVSSKRRARNFAVYFSEYRAKMNKSTDN